MVSLYDAIKLTGRIDQDKDVVYLKKDRDDDTLFSKCRPDEILTVKQLKEKYDLRYTKIVRILPYFCCNDYQGLILVIKGTGNEKN